MRPIVIADYDPSWPDLFAAERDRLSELLCGIAAEIHHVGSTSVPGMAAKPKIDIDVVIHEPRLLASAVERVREAGIHDFHGDPYGEGMWTFTRGTVSGFRVYLCGPAAAPHEKRILFRDWLRAHRADAEAYAVLKRQLAAEADGDFKAYTDGKAQFVAAIVRNAACPQAQR